MGKLGGLALVGLIALTGCAAQAGGPTSGIVPFAAAPSSTIAAAPIKAAPAAPTRKTSPGVYGDPETDAKFIAGVMKGWRGERPSDESLVSAAKFACEKFATGKKYAEIYAAGSETMDAKENSQLVAIYASRIYCTDFNTDNL